MSMQSRLVWKLGAVVATILTVAIALSGYASNLICAHYSLETARTFLRFNSESIVNGIGQQMMSRNNSGIAELIDEISRDSSVYGRLRLVSHRSEHYGEVVVSRYDFNANRDGERQLGIEDRSCTVCHRDTNDLNRAEARVADSIATLPDGERILSVVTPILNESSCSSAACHVHTNDAPTLGFLSVDYSLHQVDQMTTSRRIMVLTTVFLSLVLTIAALWLMLKQLLEKPVHELIAGTERVAANQLDFRFQQIRNDEIGVLQQSFNAMTERIQTHRDELRSAMEYLGGIVESSADIIITVTPDGFIETFNRGAEKALGYSRVEVIGKQVEVLFADPRERDAAIQQLKDTDNVKNYETRFLGKDGQVRHVLLTLSRLRDRNGESIGTFGISKDVTLEKKLQEELVRSHKFAAIGQAVTGIQHAIKNMLNALQGGAYLVRNGMAKDNRERVEDGWAMVEEGIERIDDLARGMLDYVRGWKPQLQNVDLGELVRNVCELNRQAAADRGVRLVDEIAADLPSMRCDPKLIHMATTDLVANAIDACAWKEYDSQERPEILVACVLVPEDDGCEIQVRDNGCGMDEEIRRNIFTPFFSTKKVRGTGLGLALTARIVELHGGQISVESEPEQGATFRVCLPIDGPKETRELVDGQTRSDH